MTNIENIKLLVKSPWSKAYWFARNLKNTDKFGDAGSDNDLLLKITETIRLLAIDKENYSAPELLYLSKVKIRELLLGRFKKAKKKVDRIKLLCDEIDKEIRSIEDLNVFVLTCENIIIPTNNAIVSIPNNDKEFTEGIARLYLDTLGEKGLSTVINLWDDLGVKGCLDAERAEIVSAFGGLRIALKNQTDLNDFDKDVVFTAFAQEFERRVGQKRKGRAGVSLENVTSFILQYFKIPSCSEPEHFQADIEIDKWLKTKDGWLIGISCKRTLRERWKQVSSADQNILSKYKIKHIYHLITYDEDLSDDKIAMLGGQRHIFYLRDDSRIYKHASNHVGLQNYVRPMTSFIKDLRREQS